MYEINYPYLPFGRSFRFVGANDPFMAAAKLAREECSGDRLFPVGAVLVRSGEVLARAGNGYNRGAETVHVCPRIVLECPSGTGYELCHLHDAPGHTEPMLIAAAKEQGIDPFGADVYLYGHWWCCEPCWKVMIDAGVRDVYLLQDAHIEFDRDRVYAQTLKPKVKKVQVICGDQSWFPQLAASGQELGCQVEHFRGDPQIPLITVDREHPGSVYQIEAKTVDDACRMFQNVLKQL